MKKLHILSVSLLAGFILFSFSTTSVFAQVAPGAAKLNDLQGQASGSYQNNGLNQDVGNVSTGGASGAANLLRGDSQQSGLVVVGAPANLSPSSSASKLSTGWIIFGAALLFVLIAPLVVLYKKSVDAKLSEEEPKKESAVKNVKKSEAEAETIETDVKKVEKPVKSKSKKSKNVNKAKRGKKKKK